MASQKILIFGFKQKSERAGTPEGRGILPASPPGGFDYSTDTVTVVAVLSPRWLLMTYVKLSAPVKPFCG